MAEEAAQSQEPVGWARYIADTYEWATSAMTSSEAVVTLSGALDEATCGSLSMAVGATSAVGDTLNFAADLSEGKYYEAGGDVLDFASHLSKATGYETVELCAEAVKYGKMAVEVGSDIYKKAGAAMTSEIAPPGDAERAKHWGERIGDAGALAYSSVAGTLSLGSEALKMVNPAFDGAMTLYENGVVGGVVSAADTLKSAASSTISAAYQSTQSTSQGVAPEPSGGLRL